MGDPVTMAVAGTLITGAMQGVAAKQASDAQADQLAYEREQNQLAAQDELTAAAQEEAVRRREINDTLATITAVRASRGLTQNSPGGQNIINETRRIGERNVQIGKLNRLTRSQSFKSQADFQGRQIKSVKSAGNTQAFISLLSGGSKAAAIKAGV